MVKRSGMTFIGLLGLTAVALLWQMQPGRAQNTATLVSPVAVVNITSALTGCQENREREAYIASLNDKVRSEMETLDGQVAAIQSELENALEPGSAAYKAKLQEWFDKQALRDSYEKAQTQILTTEAQLWTEALYKKFTDQIAVIAAEHGYLLVLAKDSSSLQSRSLTEMFAQIRSRKVLYHSEVIDITTEVTNAMDLAYQREKAAQAATSTR